MIPAGTAMTIAMKKDREASEMVRGNASKRIWLTGIRLPYIDDGQIGCRMQSPDQDCFETVRKMRLLRVADILERHHADPNFFRRRTARP